jgi:TPP-dependent indolepyruvate ferredoxin oxidoreductase alpha subunit
MGARKQEEVSLFENAPSAAAQFPWPVPSKKLEREFKVGERVIVSLAAGQIVEATVKAIVNRADGVRLQVDCGTAGGV